MLPAGQGLLVSGANMAGKSTFLRTLGVNAILAQRVNTALANRYAAPVFKVRSCLGRADDLLAGKSYYLAEVQAVLALLAAAETPAPHLFLFDELFHATNTIERIAAGEAVLTAVVRGGEGGRRHIALAATHDDELSRLLRHTYESAHFSDRVGPDGLAFDFRLRPGPATTRNAIALLAHQGAPEAVIHRALATAAALDALHRGAS
jgi:DNA mismatch repair ATPase MutS